MVPIIAYNYGAKHKDRMTKTIKLSILYATLIMAVGTVVFQLIPDKLFMLFDASEHMLSMGVPALRIISVHFMLAGFCIVSGSVFQALGHAVYSMITSICRQLVVLIPAAYLLSLLGEVNYVWWSLPIAELMSVLMTSIFLARVYKKVIKPMA
jgi:Na+-driven multidrug efflux pump